MLDPWMTKEEALTELESERLSRQELAYRVVELRQENYRLRHKVGKLEIIAQAWRAIENDRPLYRRALAAISWVREDPEAVQRIVDAALRQDWDRAQ